MPSCLLCLWDSFMTNDCIYLLHFCGFWTVEMWLSFIQLWTFFFFLSFTFFSFHFDMKPTCLHGNSCVEFNAVLSFLYLWINFFFFWVSTCMPHLCAHWCLIFPVGAVLHRVSWELKDIVCLLYCVKHLQKCLFELVHNVFPHFIRLQHIREMG